MLAEFRAFLEKSNVLALAVGVIIGAAVGNVVSALTDHVVMPLVGLLLPAGDWREAKLVLQGFTGTNSSILYGRFLGATIDFIIISFVVFLITRWIIKPLLSPPAEKTKSCPECLEAVPKGARRCRACTSPLVVVLPGASEAV